MKNILGIIGLLILVFVVYKIATKPSEPVVYTYVDNVEAQVTLLESELEAVQAKIDAGELTEQEAQIVREEIGARFETIIAHVASAEKAELPAEVKAKLESSLTSLVSVLNNYKETLAAVEIIADPTISIEDVTGDESIPQAGFRNMGYEFYRGSNINNVRRANLLAEATAAIRALGSHVEETGGVANISEELLAEVEVVAGDEVISEIIETATENAEQIIEEAATEEENSASTTDEMTEETGTSTEMTEGMTVEGECPLGEGNCTDLATSSNEMMEDDGEEEPAASTQ